MPSEYESKVECQDYIVYMNGEQEVGRVSAVFDLSGVPEGVRSLAHTRLSSRKFIVHVGGVLHLYMPDEYQAPKEPPVPKGLWASVRDFFTRPPHPTG